MNFNDADLDAMSRTVWGESRGEPELGQIAVAWTILNRAQRAAFAGSVAGQPGAIYRVCHAPLQFSCWNEDDPNRPQMETLSGQYPERFISSQVLSGSLPDPAGALFYHAKQITPYWAPYMRRITEIGNHVFYTNEQSKRPLLHLGSKGPYVTSVQALLGLPATGLYDAETFDKVREYQTSRNLIVDGIVGDQTYDSLGIK